MRVVKEPLITPGVCSVIPGRSLDDRGFIDTGNDLPGVDPHIYVSYAGVREMANELGLPTPEAHSELEQERDRLRQENADLRFQVEQLQEQLAAASTLRRNGFTLVKNKEAPVGA